MNRRYLEYCRVHGNSGDPDRQLAEDHKRWPGSLMTGFILWGNQQLRAFAAAHPEHVVDGRLVDHPAYDRWLQAATEPLDQ